MKRLVAFFIRLFGTVVGWLGRQRRPSPAVPLVMPAEIAIREYSSPTGKKQPPFASHCGHGHEFTEANTKWKTRKSGKQAGQRKRECRTCYNISKAASKRRARARKKFELEAVNE